MENEYSKILDLIKQDVKNLRVSLNSIGKEQLVTDVIPNTVMTIFSTILKRFNNDLSDYNNFLKSYHGNNIRESVIAETPMYFFLKELDKIEKSVVELDDINFLVKSKYEWDMLMKQLDKFNISWDGIQNPSSINRWNDYRKDTVIVLDDTIVTYGNTENSAYPSIDAKDLI
ncbi:hypothetical protein [Liquorilactobacillus mali]|uniref:Uncharacterized protein n=1 Tax=Liquorilactobacillus mali TaxID=1618 RepID=A0A0R2FTB3_9LACO|nr:hypothetical protein [Liquorilactobacillus mali]KRN31617.1 hypothetical protein IV36_GL001740 [Liquorilactobacillus mali]